jgi:hypothetical protein
MRENCNMGTADIRAVMVAFIRLKQPSLMNELVLPKQFISRWARTQLNWRIRRGTTAQRKLPDNWHEEGKTMIKRIAILLRQEKITDRSLIINFDQTGVHFIEIN